MGRRTDGETEGRNEQGRRRMKDFIGRISSAVSVRRRSDYVLMVMRVRQRQREEEGQRERERECERGREEEGYGVGQRRRAHHFCQ